MSHLESKWSDKVCTPGDGTLVLESLSYVDHPHLLSQSRRNTGLHLKKLSDHLKMAFDLKMLFGSLVMSVLLVATSAIGIQKFNEDKQTNLNKNFLIFTLVMGIVGILLSFAGGAFKLKA